MGSHRGCHNKRISRDKVFGGMAATGKTSVGQLYGFKLHLLVNDRGKLLTFYFTPGNVDGRKPVPHMAEKLWGKLLADEGYVSQALLERLFAQGVQLITTTRGNTKYRLMPKMG